jgi:hypothetical protein
LELNELLDLPYDLPSVPFQPRPRKKALKRKEKIAEVVIPRINPVWYRKLPPKKKEQK